MNRVRIFGAALAATVLVACGSEAPTRGEVKTYAQVCDKANEGKRIAVEGFLLAPTSFKAKDISVVLRIATSPERDTVAKIGSTVTIDTERKAKNTMDPLPISYSDADLKFRTDDGKTLAYSDKVRLHGTMYMPSSLATVEFTCGLSNPLIEAAQ